MLVSLERLRGFIKLTDLLKTVEVAPIYDNPGETTVLAAADVVLSLLTLMVNKPVEVDA
jgi:hypothetical protein